MAVCSCGRVVASKPCPECRRARNRARNAVPHRAAHRSELHRRIRAAVTARDGGCVDRERGGCAGPLTADYLVPLALGGAMSIENAVCRCRSHNSQRGGGLSRGGRGIEA